MTLLAVPDTCVLAINILHVVGRPMGRLTEGKHIVRLQSNLDSSNTDGSFTMANSNYILSPYEILLTGLRKQIFREIFLFYHEIVCCVTH